MNDGGDNVVRFPVRSEIGAISKDIQDYLIGKYGEEFTPLLTLALLRVASVFHKSLSDQGLAPPDFAETAQRFRENIDHLEWMDQ